MARTFFLHRQKPLMAKREPLTYFDDRSPKATSLLQLVAMLQHARFKTADKSYSGIHGRGWLMNGQTGCVLLEEHGPCDWRARNLPFAGVNGQEPVTFNELTCVYNVQR